MTQYFTTPPPDYAQHPPQADTIGHYDMVGAKEIRAAHSAHGTSRAWELTFRPQHGLDHAHEGVCAGMQIALLPVNDHARVAQVLAHLRDVPAQPIRVPVPMQSGAPSVPQALLPEQMIAHLIDLTRPTAQLTALAGAACAAIPVEDFLARHSGKISFAELLVRQPALANRKYTPSEVNKENGTISIMFSEVQHGKHAGTMTKQLHHMATQHAQGEPQTLQGFLDLRKLKLPYHAAGDAPIIMLSTGVGIAPHMAYLREEAAAGKKPNVALMLSGGRTQQDALAEQEIKSLIGDAYQYLASHDGKYVQHGLRDNSDKVWETVEAGGHIYMCGLEAMEKGVRENLKDIATQHGVEDTESWLEKITPQIHASTSAPDRFYNDKWEGQWADRQKAQLQVG